ncbi:flagellar hook-length control protein FliK [Undibacterium amnicola]|uniref:Flagellar hook-length control protein FliK n=1 Tax=Undibacterium amnicola TaxID=1834038 RepID=A0ABR6XL22_9BURK|nr:flagellar hook-length control protein FliK [Undibacterium amnicola]MBC3830215.1 flagellar hook-length control protein FliK [Undibacterium amnicola]
MPNPPTINQALPTIVSNKTSSSAIESKNNSTFNQVLKNEVALKTKKVASEQLANSHINRTNEATGTNNTKSVDQKDNSGNQDFNQIIENEFQPEDDISIIPGDTSSLIAFVNNFPNIAQVEIQVSESSAPPAISLKSEFNQMKAPVFDRSKVSDDNKRFGINDTITSEESALLRPPELPVQASSDTIVNANNQNAFISTSRHHPIESIQTDSGEQPISFSSNVVNANPPFASDDKESNHNINTDTKQTGVELNLSAMDKANKNESSIQENKSNFPLSIDKTSSVDSLDTDKFNLTERMSQGVEAGAKGEMEHKFPSQNNDRVLEVTEQLSPRPPSPQIVNQFTTNVASSNESTLTQFEISQSLGHSIDLGDRLSEPRSQSNSASGSFEKSQTEFQVPTSQKYQDNLLLKDSMALNEVHSNEFISTPSTNFQPPAANTTIGNIHAPVLSDHIGPRVGAKGWDQAIGQKIVWMVAGGEQSAQLTLNPPDLGPVQVVLSISDNFVDASFVSSHLDVREAIESAAPKLREMMDNAGISLSGFSVSAESAQSHNQFGAEKSSRGGGSQAAMPSGTESETDNTAMSLIARNTGKELGLVDTFA